MSGSRIVRQTFNFLIYTLVQVVLLKEVSLFNFAFCYIYIGFLLALPFTISRTALLVLGFSLGFVQDIFCDTLGFHAAASTLLAFFRYYVIRLLKTNEDSELDLSPSVRDMGLQWYFVYAILLVFPHHLVLLLVEASNFQLFFRVVFRAFTSSVFTLAVLIPIQYLFYPVRRRRAFN